MANNSESEDKRRLFRVGIFRKPKPLPRPSIRTQFDRADTVKAQRSQPVQPRPPVQPSIRSHFDNSDEVKARRRKPAPTKPVPIREPPMAARPAPAQRKSPIYQPRKQPGQPNQDTPPPPRFELPRQGREYRNERPPPARENQRSPEGIKRPFEAVMATQEIRDRDYIAKHFKTEQGRAAAKEAMETAGAALEDAHLRFVDACEANRRELRFYASDRLPMYHEVDAHLKEVEAITFRRYAAERNQVDQALDDTLDKLRRWERDLSLEVEKVDVAPDELKLIEYHPAPDSATEPEPEPEPSYYDPDAETLDLFCDLDEDPPAPDEGPEIRPPSL